MFNLTAKEDMAMQSEIPEHKESVIATAAVIAILLFTIYSMAKVWG